MNARALLGSPRGMAMEPRLDPPDDGACECGELDCAQCGPDWEPEALRAVALDLRARNRALEHAIAALLLIGTEGERRDYVRDLARRGVMRLPHGLKDQPSKSFAPGLNLTGPGVDDLLEGALAHVAPFGSGHMATAALLGALMGWALAPSTHGGHEAVTHAALAHLGRLDSHGRPT